MARDATKSNFTENIKDSNHALEILNEIRRMSYCKFYFNVIKRHTGIENRLGNYMI